MPSDVYYTHGVPDYPPWLFVGFAVFSLLTVWGSHASHRRKRFIEDIPRSKVRGVFIGMAEIGGRVECAAPVRSFLREADCVYFRYSIEEHWSRTVTETYVDKDGRSQTRTRTESGWTTVDSGGDMIPFYVRDDTGALLIRPRGAEIKAACIFDADCGRSDPLYYGKGPAGGVSNSTGRRRFTEYAIALNAPLEVIGQARQRTDTVAAEIAADKAAPLFLITMTPLERVSSGANRWGHVLFWILPYLLIAATLFAISQNIPFSGWVVAAALAFHCGLWCAGWLWNLYNSLAALRNRVRQAWAHIDVLLTLRADLIPNLIVCVSAMKTHERVTQESMALLRGELAATAPGKPGADFDGLSSRLTAIVEAYPEITSDASFISLSEALSDCEARLALAREYYNDFATAYNTRIERFPDRIIAGMTGFEARKLWLADHLSRDPVGVSFEPARS